MNNFNNPNGKYVGTPNFGGGTVPYSYGNYSNANLAYPNGYSPYNQNNGFIQQQPQRSEMPIQVRFVTSKEAEGYIVYPNTTELLIDKTNKVAYLKSADNLGQSTTHLFNFTPVGADGMAIEPQNNNFQNYVTKNDLEKFNFATKDQLKAVLTKVENIQKKIMGGENNGNR